MLYFNDCENILSIELTPSKPIAGEINTTGYNNLTSIVIKNASLDKIIGFNCLSLLQSIDISNDESIAPGLRGVNINEFCIQFKKSLESFNISNNFIEGEFIYGLSIIPSVRYFNVRKNMLKGIIPSLDNCQYLEYVDFSCNNFDTLPKNYSENLTYFNASNNNIFKPILNLSSTLSLKSFNVSDNQITNFEAASVPVTLVNFNASNNAFASQAVLNCLNAFNCNPSVATGTINLSGKDMPSGLSQNVCDTQIQAISAELIAKGWTVLLGEKTNNLM